MAAKKIIPAIFLLSGFILIWQVMAPIISYKIWERQNLSKETLLVSPVRASSSILGVSIQNSDNFPAIVSSRDRTEKPGYNFFELTVPRLKIENVRVLVDSNDLSSGPVHLPGSALPGERGNVFISGHSGIKGAIFAKLSDLKKDDPLTIEVEGMEFRYQVMGMKVVDPDDLSVVSPPDQQNRYLSLMTCVPPGLNIKRLVVLAKLV